MALNVMCYFFETRCRVAQSKLHHFTFERVLNNVVFNNKNR